MKLLPSLKQRKRYVVFEIVSDKKHSLAEVEEEIRRSLAAFFGQWGLSKASPLFLREKFNQEKQKFVIRVNHQFVNELRAALSLSKKIKNTPIIIRSVITSGTLKKLRPRLE